MILNYKICFQVHKVVCNQLINPEMDLQEMASSDRALCWAGMNMAEEYSEPRLEKVAARFKYCETARDFKVKINECISLVKARKEATSKLHFLVLPKYKRQFSTN